jgi:hypothetical protein
MEIILKMRIHEELSALPLVYQHSRQRKIAYQPDVLKKTVECYKSCMALQGPEVPGHETRDQDECLSTQRHLARTGSQYGFNTSQ